MARKSSRTKRVGKGNRKAAKRSKTARKTSQKTERPQQQTTPLTSTVHPRIKAQTRGDPGPALPEDFHALYDRGFRASRGMTPAAVTPRETSGHRRSAEQIEGLDVYYDQGTQLPNFIVSRQPASAIKQRRPARRRAPPCSSSRARAIFGISHRRMPAPSKWSQ